MFKSLLIAAEDLLSNKVSNIFQKPETQPNHSGQATVSKARFKNCDTETSLTPFSLNFLLRRGTKIFRSFQGYISSKNSIIYIFLKGKRIKCAF